MAGFDSRTRIGCDGFEDLALFSPDIMIQHDLGEQSRILNYSQDLLFFLWRGCPFCSDPGISGQELGWFFQWASVSSTHSFTYVPPSRTNRPMHEE